MYGSVKNNNRRPDGTRLLTPRVHSVAAFQMTVQSPTPAPSGDQNLGDQNLRRGAVPRCGAPVAIFIPLERHICYIRISRKRGKYKHRKDQVRSAAEFSS
jgi:hypothetical protein